MTGLSVLFNLNTEEACYIYGNMDAYRRMHEQSRQEGYGNMANMDSYRRVNEQSRQEMYPGGTTDRSTSYRDLRYVPSSELSCYTPRYTEREQRYRSQYGLHTDSHRDLYQTYPGVKTNFSTSVNSNLYPDGGGLSSYTRNYGVRNTNIDIATKSFDSARLFDRRSPITDRPILELGTDFRRRYHSDKTHDVTGASGYSRDSGGDVSTISPARSKSLRDHERHKEEPVETLRPPSGRQRLNSNDSISSQTSERSEKGDNSKALFKAYQNRYKEHAEETPAKTPFSSWRRSGNFEDEHKPIESKSVEPEKSRVEMKSRVFASAEESERQDRDKKDRKHERIKKVEKQEIGRDVVFPKHQEGDKGDELMSNFRQALRRHQISEERKVSEERDSSKDTEKSTAAMIEKIRAAKAQIKQMKESHAKSDDSKDESLSHERNKLPSTSSVEKTTDVNKSDEKSALKTVPKLARQKLVSDDLKAKYIESKKDEKVNEETVRPKETESESRKHSRLKAVEHKEDKNYSRLKEKEPRDLEKSENAIVKASEPKQSRVTQDKKDFRKAIADKFKRESSGFEFGTSFTKPKSVDSKDDQKLISSDKMVEKIEQGEETDKIPETAKSVYKFVPKTDKTEQREDTVNIPETAKSVYKFVPKTDKIAETANSAPKIVPKGTVKPIEEVKDVDFSHKPVSALVYQEPTSKTSTSDTFGVLYSPQSSSATQVLSYKSSEGKEIDKNEKVGVESKVKDKGHKPRRQMKKHTKAKSFELGLLSRPTEEKSEVLETQDDSSVIPKLSADELSRKERIDKYKEERKKQLATIFVGGESELPSLFLSSRPETDSVLSRSRSLKVDSDTKPDSAMAPVRSKSMKEASPAHVSKISGLQLAELGSQSKDTYEKQSRDEVAKQTAKSASTKDQKDSKEITHRTMLAEMVLAEDKEHALKSSFEKETDSGHESTDSSRRIRRQLPSLEDVLGKNVMENRYDENKLEAKQGYTDLKKPKETKQVKPPAEFSLDYSKVKITPKSIPVEMSQGRVISKKFDIIQPAEEIYNGFSSGERNAYQTSEPDGRKKFDTTEAEASFEDLERSIDQKDTSSELTDSEIPKDSVSKMSQYFMHSEKQDRPDNMVFASVYNKQKPETDIKPNQEAIRKYSSEEIYDEHFKKGYDARIKDARVKEGPVPERAVISEEFSKQSESRSSTPERVISVSEARKVFSESTSKQVFGTDFVHKDKEPEKTDPSKYTQALADIDSVFRDTETELKRQLLLGVRSSSAELSDSVIDRTQSSPSQQKSRQYYEVPSSDETRAHSAAKPPVSPRTERKRVKDTKFKKVSYRSSESDESKFDMVKERESSKSRELSKEKELQKRTSNKERSPSLESIPKADVRMRQGVKERSPSVESIPKTGVTKISYRDLERARQEKTLKFGNESSGESLVFGSDYRKPVTKPDIKSDTHDYMKPTTGAFTEENFETIQSFSDYYDKHTAETDTKDKEVKHGKLARDMRMFQVETDSKHGSEAMMFGSDYRKPKADIKPEMKPTKVDDQMQDSVQTGETRRHFEQSTIAAHPTVHKADRKETYKNTEEKTIALNVQAGYSSREEKMHVLKPAEAKVDIKAEAVSAASGQIMEVPVSPRQKSPPKIVSLNKQETVSKIEVKPEIKLITKPKAVEEPKVEQKGHKAPAQITTEKQGSEPLVVEKSDKLIPDTKPKVAPLDRQTIQLTRTSETAEKVKPVQYVHPSPLLSFSAKTETSKKTGLITETKVTSQIENKTEVISPADKDDNKSERVRESDKEFISKRAKEEAWKKPVDTTSEFHKKTVEKMLLDTSLDDILSRNADYLSDSEKTSGSGRGRAEKKTRPQSVHEESRSHGRTKRIFKKKNLQRSKSEDRSHFKVDDAGAVRRSRGTEDIVKSQRSGPGGVSRGHDSRRNRTFLQGETTSTDTDSTSSERISRFDSRRKPKSEGNVEKVLVKASVAVDKSKASPNDTAEDKIRSVPNDSQTGPDEVLGKIGENVENQTGIRGRDSSEWDFSDTVSDLVTHSSMDLLSASDTSDFPDRRLQGDGKEVGEVYKRLATPESDLSAASSSITGSDGARKRRKDKSSLRKSKLNESSDDSVTRRRDDPSLMNKIGVRRVSSSRLARESRDDKYKEEADRRLQEAEKLTNKRESSLNRRNRNVNQSNNLSSAQNKSLNNLDQITSHSRVIHSSVLDSKTVLPSRFALPSKVSSAISKLSEASDRANKESSPGPKDERTPSPRGIRRGNNFSALLQKFSSSDASGSEKSDSDSLSHATRKPFLTRQEACALSSSTSSEDTHRTPERTQSLRLRGSRSAALEKEGSPVQRSSSFKSDFMKQRFSPEPEQRRRLPETPVKQTDNGEKSDKNMEKLEKAQKPVTEESDKTPKHVIEQFDKHHKTVSEQSDKPSPELASVLNKRSEIVKKQQETGEVNERRRIHDRNVEKADRFSPASVDDVIVDSEVAKMLRTRRKETETGEAPDQKIHDGKVEKADRFSPASVDDVIADFEVAKMLRTRRKETDSSLESVSDKDTKSQAAAHHSHSQRELEIENIRARSQTQEKSQIKSEIPKPVSQSLLESKTSIQIASQRPKAEDHSVAIHDKENVTDANVTATVPKLDFSSIDKSLAVLEHVTQELEEPDDHVKDEKEQKLHNALSNVHVDKQAEVVQFINSVEGDDLNASHVVIQPKVSDSQLNVDVKKVEKERTTGNTSNNAIHDKETDILDSKKEGVKEIRQNKQIAKDSQEHSKRVESKVNGKLEESVRSESPNTAGTVDITNKSEIKRKMTREKAPEQQSPSRSGPMKVMSHVKVNASAGLTRTESVGRSESERPKGILKRTPSLHKTGVYVDPELANILKTRRAKHEEVEEESETQKLSAQEEIKRSRESQPSQEEDGEGQSVSVAERIFQMHTKIEEVRSCPITPKSRSGLTTPKSALNKSGALTHKSQFSFDEAGTGKASPISGPQLIERLTSLEGQQSAVRDRRNKYQERRKQDDWRTRTQPVTLLEIQEADSLETVRKFRSEILHKASTNVFENLEKEDKSIGKKTEFPQPFRKDRRPRGLRHKTLPVTAAELNAVPEDQIAETMNSIKRKFEALGSRDSRADSGILSGSEVDVTDRDADSLKNTKENIPEDDPVKLSVSAKASIFHQLEEKSKERDKKSASGAKRYIDRKKRERSRTQPITEDEVHTAAVKADEENAAEDKDTVGDDGTKDVASEKDEVPDEGQGDADELSRQSLADKVKLFKQIEEKDKSVPKKAPPPPPKRRNRKLASRFATQPVTYEEVEKAAKISPLAMSLVKPPDPEMLAGMSVKAQREIMAEHAQKALSQPGSRSGSRPVSRATSVGDLSGEPDNKGGTKSDSNSNLKTDITSKDVPKDNEIKIIRKLDKDKTEFLSDRKDFRKSQELEKETEEVRSILKLDEASSEKSEGVKATRNILKQQLEEKLTLHLKGESKVKGLVKMDSESVRTTSEIESVLIKESVIETNNKPPEPKGILKKEGSFEQRNIDLDKVIAELPKVEDISEQGGVSDDSLDNLDSDDNLLSHSPTPEDDRTVESKDTPVRRRSSKSRRRFNRERKLEAERYHTQPAEVKQDEDESPTRRKNAYAGRHLTQPITPTEKKQAEVATEMPEIKKTGSITDRLNALKKSGDEEWRKRVAKPSDLDTITPTKTPPPVKMREKKGLDMPRPSSIADRLTLLDTAQEGWRGRVGETDVKMFTIEHKLTASGQGQGESPLVARLRQKPKRDTSRGQSRPTTLATIKSMEEEEKKGPVNVEVPQIGQEIEEFFQTNTNRDSVLSETGLNFDVDDFNELFLSANDILSSTRKIRPKRRHTATSRNPLKTMSMCLDVRTEYTEVITGVADKELKRIQTAKIAQGSGFAVEALAGLASKENFSKIELRKTESTGSGSGNTRHDPYLPLMLIHIKGRRKVQCRLVEPKASSLNSGDCFVVVTPDKIVQWNGDYCNVIEKAKAADVADFVKKKRDLGCKALGVTSIEERRSLMGKSFFSLIGGLKDYMNCGPPEEDELYENHIVDTNMVYKLEKNKLVPVEEYWGNQPKYEMLKPDQVFVFDFGSELYIWQGKSVTPAQRKIGLKLAEQLWEKGYDYTSCEVNPLCPLKTEDEGGLPMAADSRPDWALFGKVNQNMETILFREKFADWPDTSRLIKAKSNEEVTTSKFDIADLKPYDAKLMVPVNTSPVSLKLEGSHVGRGNKWEENMEGFMRQQDIQTLKVVVWHVLEYDHFQVEEHSYGQFHEGDTYVIRWSYMIINAGMRSLKGEASRHTQLGRERCAYFFWQGKSSTINEKGASALMTVELDEERGPQVLVEEGKEPACFLNLFKGRMIIHIGKREEESTNTQGNWRFYCLRNEYENEMCLIEVPTEISSLRSVSSFVLLNVKTGALTVWHGCKSPDHTRKLALKAADNLKERCPLEVGLHKNVSISITEVEEGHERTDFWRTMNVHLRDRSLYCSLLNNPESFNHTLRLFHMTSVSGVFDVHEIINPSRSPDLPTKFPVLQTDLYKVSQPGLFLIDNGHEVYLWQGWWPEGDENQENVLTGSAQTRFTADRKCAMETTLHYCKEINPDSPPSAFVVYAGLEPLQFTNLFPFWTVDERVREINLKEGKQDGELVPVEELLKKVTKTRFTLAELQEPTLPEGVDPLKLESYLSDDEFEELFSMNKEEFYALPSWKQQKVKQEAGLF